MNRALGKNHLGETRHFHRAHVNDPRFDRKREVQKWKQNKNAALAIILHKMIRQKRAVILSVQSTPASKLYREQIGSAKFEVEKVSSWNFLLTRSKLKFKLYISCNVRPFLSPVVLSSFVLCLSWTWEGRPTERKRTQSKERNSKLFL